MSIFSLFLIISFIAAMIYRRHAYIHTATDISKPSTTDLNLNWENPFTLTFSLFLWIKLRIIYYVNNWVYTTNHKRIAVNYYWFVIFAGICGMVLATIIRLEMAYPGVGILAGDSLQYLCVVTAHAVIMVFFMIMPLLFGAFGNFLLPTQLGVHDVAFPRLNSAAFWFLPAGLLMLVQLVCLDRRYQRMNCYNIREIQSLLKSKHSPNVSDNTDVHLSLDDTTLGLRYQIGGLSFIDVSMLTYYYNALLTSSRYRAVHAFMNKPIAEFDVVKKFMGRLTFMFNVLWVMCEDRTLDVSFLFSPFFNARGVGPTAMMNQFLPSNNLTTSTWSYNYPDTEAELRVRNWLCGDDHEHAYFVEKVVKVAASSLKSSFVGWSEFCIYPMYSLVSFVNSPFTFLARPFSASYSTLNFSGLLPSRDISLFISTAVHLNPLWSTDNTSFTADSSNSSSEYTSSLQSNTSLLEQSATMTQEQTTEQRFLRNMNPIFKYDFKVGNYLPDDAKKMNPHLFNTIKDVTTGIRKSSWFASPDYLRMLQANIATHTLYFANHTSTSLTTPELTALASELDGTFSANSANSTNVSFTGGFYNFFILLSSSSEKLNVRWLGVNALDQKFYKMFATGSLQQRIHANWRQFKFSREAWRCKLLAARHQNTLYKRYLDEDSVVWAVERNAKDVLPGWAMITPFSARSRFTAIGKVDLGLMGVFLVLNSSIVSSANFLVTYRYLSTLNNRKMRDARSFFTEGVMVASWMMIAANPMLAIGILMLLCDRHWQTSFFDYSGGGDTVLFQHMFWFFGHPEVYVIMIPGFGFNNTILSFYLRKRVSARASLLYSMYTIAFLGFFVWGHHMYMVGLAHTTRMLFSTLTVMISVPAATKLMHWCVTLVNSSFVLELPMVFQLLFIFFFVSGGISGMAVAHTGMDILFHDSFYVVGHFHVMLAGSAMFASFGAFYFYFPAIFGLKFSRIYGYLHCIYYLTGQLMTVIPMFWLGYAAMPRRVLDYPAALGGWHAVVSAGHMLSVAGMMAFFIMIFDSMRQGRAATRNSFGVARFNTRLNFYIYEGARTWFLQRKGWYLSRFNRHNSVRLNKLNYHNNEFLETTLYSYVLLKK